MPACNWIPAVEAIATAIGGVGLAFAAAWALRGIFAGK